MPAAPRFEDTPQDTPAQPGPPSPPGAPRWAKVTGIAVLVVVVLLVVFKLAGVEHGPGRHGGSGGSAQTPVSQVHDAPQP